MKHCSRGIRKDERHIDVIDTPGVNDTTWGWQYFDMLNYINNHQHQNQILQEVAQIFAMAPEGFDAIILTVMYGHRFTAEDSRALKMLQTFLGKDATENMIFLLTHGDQAEREAAENGETVEQTLEKWLKTLPDWVQNFIGEIKGRAFLFNNLLRPDKQPEEYQKQLSRLIAVRLQITNHVHSRDSFLLIVLSECELSVSNTRKCYNCC